MVFESFLWKHPGRLSRSRQTGKRKAPGDFLQPQANPVIQRKFPQVSIRPSRFARASEGLDARGETAVAATHRSGWQGWIRLGLGALAFSSLVITGCKKDAPQAGAAAAGGAPQAM